MSQRITVTQLRALAARMNEVTGAPRVAWTKPERSERYVASVGNYHIDMAYGGFCLHRMVNDSGGVSDVFSRGHIPARELFGMMDAWLLGFKVGHEQATKA